MCCSLPTSFMAKFDYNFCNGSFRGPIFVDGRMPVNICVSFVSVAFALSSQ